MPPRTRPPETTRRGRHRRGDQGFPCHPTAQACPRPEVELVIGARGSRTMRMFSQSKRNEGLQKLAASIAQGGWLLRQKAFTRG